MFKILQVRLQQYVNNELLDFKMVLEKAEELDIKLPTSVAAAAAAKSLQSCPTLCSPIDGSCCTNGRQKRSSLALSLAQSCSCSLARSLMGEICSKYLKSIHSVKTQGHVSATGVHLQ